MKTIRNKVTKEVKRIKEKAARQVLDAPWAYCPKSTWKTRKDKPIVLTNLSDLDAIEIKE